MNELITNIFNEVEELLVESTLESKVKFEEKNPCTSVEMKMRFHEWNDFHRLVNGSFVLILNSLSCGLSIKMFQMINNFEL